MSIDETVTFEDGSEEWLCEILTMHYEEALSRAASLLADTEEQPTGCLTTPTQGPRKTRFHGRQGAAYRFVYCVLNQEVIAGDMVVRHRCNNRRCINPAHLMIGTRADNKQDDWDFAANGVDYGLL